MTTNPLHGKSRIFAWILQIIDIVILGQSLFFKFTSAPEAVALFQKLGVEPWGRYATGIVELAAIVLLLMPRSSAYGSLIAAGLMVGAISSHLTVLGIEVAGDGGTLFAMACLVFVSSLGVLWLRRTQLAFVHVRGAVVAN